MSKYEYKTTPYRHQIEILQKSWNKEAYALFTEMGTGKTKIIIDNACALYLKGMIDGLVIIAPKGTYLNWRTELETHAPDYVDYALAWWTPTPDREERHRMTVHFNDSEHLHILLVNVEAMSSMKKRKSRGAKYAHDWVRMHKCMAVVDESTMIKNHNASRTETVLSLAPHAKYRRILSGNPIPNSVLDLWSQCAFLGTSYLGWESYYAYKHHYAITKRRSVGPDSKKHYEQVVGYCDELVEKELVPRLSLFSSKIRKEECLDLPPKIYQKIDIELTDDQRTVYKQMSKHAVAKYENELGQNGHVSVTTIISLMLRLHQISCGFVTLNVETGEFEDPDEEYPKYEKVIQDLPNERMPALLQQIEEIDGKIIVWAHYIHNIEKIVEELGKKYGEQSVCGYYGRTKQKDRELYRKRFQDSRDSLRFFVANRAGAYGNTLTQAHNVIYHSNTFDLDIRMQSEDRCHRIGQENKVTYIDIIAKKTIDELIISSLRKKIKMVDLVMGDMGRRALEYL